MSGAYVPGANAPVTQAPPEQSRAADYLLQKMVELGGSDLHVSVDQPPYFHVDGRWRPATDRPLSRDLVIKMCHQVLEDPRDAERPERLWDQFMEHKELDTAYELEGVSRFRVNIAMERGNPTMTLRGIPHEIKSLDDLKMPPVLKTFSTFSRGLVLVTGPTGSGKTTTLASIIDLINSDVGGKIVTIEDPIEFVHSNKKSVIIQREVGEDTESFSTALRASLRQKPDVILVGEMRDKETIETAITAAETGHLVFGTLHTSSAAASVNRIVDVFPEGQQSQIRTQLAGSLNAVVCQTLLPTLGGQGRIPALEIMVVNSSIRSNISQEGGIAQIPTYIHSSMKEGNQLMDHHLVQLARARKISGQTAFIAAHKKDRVSKDLQASGIDY